jgi:hypothetical protein
MISRDISAVSSSPARDQNFDIPVESETQMNLAISTDEIQELSARFENPFIVTAANLDFGVRIGLPESNRHFIIKQSNNVGESHAVHLSIIFDHNGQTFWTKSIPLSTYDPRQFDLRMVKIGDSLVVVLDGVRYALTGTNLDFGFDTFNNLEFFVNSDKKIVDSRDARFLQSPFVRITNFGVWGN